MRLQIGILRLATYTFGQHNYRSFDPSVEEAKQKIKTETKTKNIRKKNTFDTFDCSNEETL